MGRVTSSLSSSITIAPGRSPRRRLVASGTAPFGPAFGASCGGFWPYWSAYSLLDLSVLSLNKSSSSLGRERKLVNRPRPRTLNRDQHHNLTNESLPQMKSHHPTREARRARAKVRSHCYFIVRPDLLQLGRLTRVLAATPDMAQALGTRMSSHQA